MNLPEIISLNIGGSIFTTSLTTLRQDPQSMLARMFSGLMNTKQDQHGNFFIDRDGTHFGLILNFLRDHDVDLPISPLHRKQLLREALFYQVQGLIEMLGGAGDLLPVIVSPPKQLNALSLLDQAALYAIHKEQLYQKYKQLWDSAKTTIKGEFGRQALTSCTLSCSFPLQQEFLAIAPFILKELQEEGLRDIIFYTNYQSGITFALNLDKISDSEVVEQQFSALRLMQQNQCLREPFQQLKLSTEVQT